MSAGRTQRISRTFVLMALAIAFPVVTMAPAGAQCYPPPCGPPIGGGGGATTTSPPTTRPVVATTTTAPRATTTTRVAPVAPGAPDKSVKAPEEAAGSGRSLLSRTGANIVPLLAIAVVLTLSGLALAGVARRRTATVGSIQPPG